MFHFKIAKGSELKELKEMGINRLPAMTIGKDHYIGVPSIVSELRNRVKLNTDEAAMKTDDEVLSDFQQSTLMNDVKKNSDGQFIINDNNDDDKDKDELMSSFNKEIARRTGSAQSDAAQKINRPVQEQSRPTQQPRQPQQQRQQQRPPHREDNINDDAMQSLQNIRKGASGEDAQDDTMMEALLARMSSD